MAAYQAHPAGMQMPHHMGQVPPGNPAMGQPPGSMPPQIHPHMRPGPQGAQAGNMMAPGMSMQPGVPGHAVAHMQPGMFVGNQPMPQNQGFQQMPHNGIRDPQQQALMRRQAMMHMQQANPAMANMQNMMMPGAPQMAMNPMMAQMRAVSLPGHMQQQLVQQQERHNDPHRPNTMIHPHNFQNAQANGQQMHVGQAPQMRPQASMQGMREHMGQGAHPQTGLQMGNQTPQGQMQRPRPPQQPGTLPQNQPSTVQTTVPNAQPGQPNQPQQPPQEHPGPNPAQRPQNPAAMQGMPSAAQQQQQQRLQAQAQAQAQNPQLNQNPATTQAELASGQQPQMQQPNPQAAANQERLRQLNQMNQMKMYQQQAQLQQVTNSVAALRMQQFCQNLNNISNGAGRKELVEWQRLVAEFFDDDGVFHISHPNQSQKDSQVAAPVLARYFLAHFTSGVRRMQIALGAGDPPIEGRTRTDEIPTTFTYFLDSGVQTNITGYLRAMANASQKLLLLQFTNVKCEEFVPRNMLELIASNEANKSPEKSKTNKQKQRNPLRTIDLDLLPASQSDFGIPRQLQHFVEATNIMSHMTSLFQFAQQHPHLKPQDALAQLVETNSARPMAGQPTFTQPMFGMPNGVMRTPSLNGPMQSNLNYFPSPAHTHPNLPNNTSSPHLGGHTPSPNHAGMQAPQMMAQHSHQGLASNAGSSSNASPNVSGKRRRQSLAKMEDNGMDLNGMGMNAQANKIKASPRPGKKMKGNA